MKRTREWALAEFYGALLERLEQVCHDSRIELAAGLGIEDVPNRLATMRRALEVTVKAIDLASAPDTKAEAVDESTAVLRDNIRTALVRRKGKS